MVVYVRDIYSKRIRTIEADLTLKDAAKMMNNMGISCLIVVKDGSAVGILTERDMMRSIMLDLVNLHKLQVKTFMSTNIITVQENASVEEAIRLMVGYKIKKLPVTGALGDGTALIGMLSMTDIVTRFPELESRFSQPEDHKAELNNFPYLAVKN